MLRRARQLPLPPLPLLPDNSGRLAIRDDELHTILLCMMPQAEFEAIYNKHAPKEPSKGFGVGWAARKEREWQAMVAARKAAARRGG